MGRRRRISIADNTAVITVSRAATKYDRIAYLLVADRSIRYAPGRRSRIVYIGKSIKGLKRAAASIARKAIDIFRNTKTRQRGVRQLKAYIVSTRMNGTRWREDATSVLERALIISFCDRYGRTPLFNKHGHKLLVRDQRREQRFLNGKRATGSVFRTIGRRAARKLVEAFEGFG